MGVRLGGWGLIYWIQLWEWTYFDRVVWILRRETQYAGCRVYLADVCDGHWLYTILTWFAGGAVFVRDGVVDYGGHGSSSDGGCCEG